MNQGVDAAATTPKRAHLGRDLTIIGVVLAVLLGAAAAGVVVLYQQLYSPKAFVERYLSLLSDGRAADALTMPGVPIDSAELQAAGLPLAASDALLRQAALGSLTDIETTETVTVGETTVVHVAYKAGGHAGTTMFTVERNGWIGVAPAWRFARSPLSVIDVHVRGSMQFSVNDFRLDKRQVSPDMLDAEPFEPVPMLVFSPGLYHVAVDTAIAATPGVNVLADQPLVTVPVDLQAEPTQEFVDVVQQRVDEFLAACATQEVLQPTACPFGYFVADRIDGPPKWSIAADPVITVVPDDAHWAIPATEAVAHIAVDIVSLFDGSVQHTSEDVPFTVSGTITVLPDDSVAIHVGGG